MLFIPSGYKNCYIYNMRKFFGILLIIIGWFIGFCACLSTVPNIIKISKEDTELINKVSFLVGTFIGFGLLALLAWRLVKTGFQLIKKKKVNDLQEKMESIK